MHHPLSRLIARYGRDEGLYLYGEYVSMVTLGFEAFASRHTPALMLQLERRLAPLALWHGPPLSVIGPDGPPDGPVLQGQGGVDAVLFSLARPPLTWVAGGDLYLSEAAWAESAATEPGTWFEPSRRDLGEAWGLPLPPMAVTLDAALPAHAFRLEVAGETVLFGEAYPGLDMVIHPGPEEPPALPYPWTPDPVAAGVVAWMPIGPAASPPAGCDRLHWLAAVSRHVAWGVERNLHRLVGPQAVSALLEAARRQGIDGELGRYVSPAEFQRVFRALLAQGLPLRGLSGVYEGLLQAILCDLAGRTLTPQDAERLGRQLPMFSTARLVGIIRNIWGLPAEPPLPPERRPS